MSKYVGFRLGKVHESHEVSEYYCGGCGWPVTDHDSFCPECGGAFRECDASNLEAENAKLRELCGDLLMCIKMADKSRDGAWEFCPVCPLWDGNNSRRCEFSRRARDLGIEVDG